MLTINYFSVTLFGGYQFGFTDEQARIAYGQFMAHDTIHAETEEEDDEVYIPFHSIANAYLNRGDVDLVPKVDDNCVGSGSCDGLYFFTYLDDTSQMVSDGDTITFGTSSVIEFYVLNTPEFPEVPDASMFVPFTVDIDNPDFGVSPIEGPGIEIDNGYGGTGVMKVTAEDYDCTASFILVAEET